MLEVDIMEGSGLRGEPSTLKANIMDGSGAIGRTLHAERQYHGRFRDTATQILHMEATAGRQEGPFRSPTQSCRSVARPLKKGLTIYVSENRIYE